MDIKILGTGCPNCQKLEANMKKALQELNIPASAEKVGDMEKIVSYGVMSLPAIVADGKVLSCGKVLSTDEIKKLLSDNEAASHASGCCSHEGGCC